MESITEMALKKFAEIPQLKDSLVQLDPLSSSGDFEYLFSLMPKYRYNLGTRPQNRYLTIRYGRHFWVGRTDSFVGKVRGGVIYLCYFPQWDIWSFDAYRDDELLKALNRRGNFSYHAGTLVMDWFFKTYQKNLITVHDVRSRASTAMCRRLGFVPRETRPTPVGDFLIMEKKYEGVSNG